MYRKLVKHGNGGITLFLPIDWIRENSLEQGGQVHLTPNKNNLLITTDKKTIKKEIKLELNTLSEPIIRTQLNYIYRLGFEKATLSFNTKKQVKIIENCIDNFLFGFEISEIHESYLIIESIAESDADKYKILLRKMFLLIKESFEIIKEDLKTNKFDNLNKIKKLTQKIGQQDNLCRRNITQKKFEEDRENCYWGLFKYLLLIQHSSLHLYEFFTKLNTTKQTKKTEQLFLEITKNYGNIYSAFFKKDISNINAANQEIQKILYNKIHNKEFHNLDFSVLYYFGELSRLIYLTTAPMMGILM